MRILYWTELFWPSIGGIEVRCRHLARALRARGHEAAVVTSQGNHPLPDRDSVDGIVIHRFRFLEALAERQLDLFASERRRLAQLKKEFRADVVHVLLTDPSVIFHWQTQPVAPAPTVVGIVIGLERQKAEADTLLQRTLMQADWTLAVSDAMLADVRRLVPAIEGRSSVIYNSIEEPLIAPEPLPFHEPTLLCLGRVVPEKGFDVALDAFAEVRKRFARARLLIAGDGPARSDLEKQAAGLGIADAVEFTGWIQPEEVPRLINKATVVIVPSRWREAFGNVAVQAMQMARPLVAASVGGLAEIVEDGVTGCLVPSEDPATLAQAVSRLLADPIAATRMGDAGRKRALCKFSFQGYVEAHEALYRRIIQEKQ